MAATIGLFADSMEWIIGMSGGPLIGDPNSLMSAPVVKTMQTGDIIGGVHMEGEARTHMLATHS